MNQTPSLSRKLLHIVTLAAACCAFSSMPAFGANKDMVQLQTQIQQLQDAVARLQQSNDERMGVMKDLVQQSADSINKMSTTVDALQRGMQTQQEAQGAKVDQVSGQVQALNDSLDEIKTRIGRLEKLMQDVQGQQQSMSANMQGMPAGGGTMTAPPVSNVPASSLPSSAPTGSSLDTSAPASPNTSRRGKPSAGTPLDTPGVSSVAPAAGAGLPPPDDLYKTALGDYMAAKYGLASSEFSDITRSYPDHPLAGNAYYYQGEMDFRGARFAAAIKDYDRVIEQFPDNNKVPAAHLHKAQSLIQLKQNEAGVRELRALIQRFPNSPEAMQARSRLSGMGVPVRPKA